MKFPDDPKERQQWYMLIGIFGLIGVYAIYMAVNTLFLKPLDERNKIVESLSGKVSKADEDVEMMPILKEKNNEHVAEITKLSDTYVLHPQLGNYLIPAEQFIRAQEAATEVHVLEVKEVGISECPPPDPPKPVEGEGGHGEPVVAAKKEYAFKIYTARVEVDNGYHDFIKLIEQIQKANPFVSISSATLMPQDDSPFKHSMNFDIQWPIWNPTKSTEKILQLLNSEVFRQSIKTTVQSPSAKTQSKAKKKNKKTAQPVSSDVQDKLKELGVPVQ